MARANRPTRGTLKGKAGKENQEVTDMLNRYWQDEQGLATVEYALLLALIVAVALTAWTTLGSKVNSVVSEAGTEIFGS